MEVMELMSWDDIEGDQKKYTIIGGDDKETKQET